MDIAFSDTLVPMDQALFSQFEDLANSPEGKLFAAFLLEQAAHNINQLREKLFESNYQEAFKLEVKARMLEEIADFITEKIPEAASEQKKSE